MRASTRSAPNRLDEVRASLLARPRHWLVTGCAGFIGSNLLESLLLLDQRVTGLDNFSTGFAANLDEVKNSVGSRRWNNFRLVQGDLREPADCRQAMVAVQCVLHQAALGSVPRSLEDPLATHENNVTGFLNMLVAARDARVDSFVYAASSAVYGDHPGLPKVEDQVGKPLSPYAASKSFNETYASVFATCYGLKTVGLRYFNVFGKRQDPQGAYAAVIPRWIAAMAAGRRIAINGDGETSRDFSYVENAVQANLLATLAPAAAWDQVYNVAVGDNTTLNALFLMLREVLAQHDVHYELAPEFRPLRSGDVRHSHADLAKSRRMLGYQPSHTLRQGLDSTMPWYLARNVRLHKAQPATSLHPRSLT
ncbi:MAG: UDP-glucose 4-epimerase [Paucimonas sp.]|nr:UDP-glucose 4-epimerase [Paucimonas sp.]